MEPTAAPVRPKDKATPDQLDQDHGKAQHGKGKVGSLENPEVYENVPGHLIPILEREFDDFDTEAKSFLDGQQSEEQFIGFRLKQGVYGQRQPDVQMIRVKLPMGGDQPGADGRVRLGDREVRPARQGPHHHPPEHPDPPRPAARRRQADPRDLRGRALLARGLREHGPQRHRRPVRRRHARASRSTSPLRRRLRPLLRAPPHHPADAAQDQDRVQRDRRGRRDHRHPRHRLHRARARRRPRCRDPGRWRHLDHAPHRPHALRVRRARQRRVPEGDGGRAADLRPPGLAAGEPRPRPDQGPGRQDRDGRLPRAGRRRARGRLGRGARLRRRPPQLRLRRGTGGADRRRAWRRYCLAERRRLRTFEALPPVQRQGPAPGGLLDGRRQGHARRPHSGAAPRPRRDHARVHRRLRPDHRPAEPGAALGPRRGGLRRLAAGSASSGWPSPAPARSPTSCPARAPTAASWGSPARWA